MSGHVCSRCDDTHVMRLNERDVPCTHCPVPCDGCRQRLGAYCHKTPCDCRCHLRRNPDGSRFGITDPSDDERKIDQLSVRLQETLFENATLIDRCNALKEEKQRIIDVAWNEAVEQTTNHAVAMLTNGVVILGAEEIRLALLDLKRKV